MKFIDGRIDVSCVYVGLFMKFGKNIIGW